MKVVWFLVVLGLLSCRLPLPSEARLRSTTLYTEGGRSFCRDTFFCAGSDVRVGVSVEVEFLYEDEWEEAGG